MALWVVGLSLAASQSWGAYASWTATGNGTVGYWTNNANWSAAYPGSGASGEAPTFNTVAGSSYTAILDTALPFPLGVFYCPDTGGSGSSRVIVTNCVLTMAGADPVVQFYRGFTLQIEAGGVVTNVYQNCQDDGCQRQRGATKECAVFLNGVLVRQKLPFINPSLTSYSSVTLVNDATNAACLDDMYIGTVYPDSLNADQNNNHIPDAQEIMLSGDVLTFGAVYRIR
jgi:hypothetical protein